MANNSFELAVRQDFVHVQLEPAFEISLNSMRRMWGAVLPVCEQHALRRVLVEGDRPTRSMRKIEAYEHGRLIAQLDLRGLRVAFCLHEYEADELSYVFTTVVSGSFNAARFFLRVEDAMAWLGG